MSGNSRGQDGPGEARPRAARRNVLIGSVVLLVLLLALLLPQAFRQDEAPAPPPPSGGPTTTTSSPAPTAAKLTRQGNQLMFEGKPYKYVGLNAYGLNGQETGWPYKKDKVDGLFRALPPNTITRTWAWQARPVESLDDIVRSAEEHGQMLILSLSEGAGFGEDGKRDASWYREDYKSDLLPWIDQIVPRFRGSPAIAMWEITNEPGNHGATTGEVKPEEMKSFFDTVAARIKQHDPYHLVETGTMDSEQNGTQDWVALNSGPNIDVVSIHEYADEYEDGAIISKHFLKVTEQNKQIGKPVIIGEVGVRGADAQCVRSRQDRVGIMRKKFDGYFAAGVSGINVWNWTGTNSDQCESGQNIKNDDPMMDLLRSYKPWDVKPSVGTSAPSGTTTGTATQGATGGTSSPAGSSSSAP